MPDLVLELVRKATPYLAHHGSPSARLDAELLLAEVLGCGRMDLYLQFERPVLNDELDRFRELCRRRASGEPIAYIRGRREFMTIELAVSPAVLVPRPETEILVEEAIRRLSAIPSGRSAEVNVPVDTSRRSDGFSAGAPRQPDAGTSEPPVVASQADRDPAEPAPGAFDAETIASDAAASTPVPAASAPARRLLDVGTGSGAIALAVLAACPAVTAVATDISPSALEVARSNAARLELAGRIEFIEADLANGVSGTFDVLTANLPYIDPAWVDALTPEVAATEPAIALFGGSDGMDHIGRLLTNVPSLVRPGGVALFEFDPRQSTVLLAAASSVGKLTVLKDLAGDDRVLVLEP